MSEQKPVVRHAFKYGAKPYQPGQVFEPQGQPNDAMILKSSLIAYQDVESGEASAPKPQGGRKAKKNVIP